MAGLPMAGPSQPVLLTCQEVPTPFLGIVLGVAALLPAHQASSHPTEG